MNRVGAIAALVLMMQTADAVEGPYNERANAAAEIHQALEAARSDHKLVLLVFGANWCAECRGFDRALRGTSRTLIEGKLHVVKIDIGNFDKNLGISAQYDDPIKMGIPAVVLLSADNQVIYVTKAGELADARRMGGNRDLRLLIEDSFREVSEVTEHSCGYHDEGTMEPVSASVPAAIALADCL